MASLLLWHRGNWRGLGGEKRAGDRRHRGFLWRRSGGEA